MPGSGFAVTPDEVSLTTGPTGEEIVGAASQKRSYNVPGEEGDRFLIDFGGGQGRVDSACCLINLPDYLRGICDYDIKNRFLTPGFHEEDGRN